MAVIGSSCGARSGIVARASCRP